MRAIGVWARDLPVTGQAPFLDPAEQLGAAPGPVGRVEERAQIELGTAEIVQEGGRRLVPARPNRLIKRGRARFPETPIALHHIAVASVVEGQCGNPAFEVIAPAVERTGEHAGVAFVIAAHAVPPMTAGVEKDVHLTLLVPHDDHRLFAHSPEDIIARIRNLAFVAHKEPGAREDLLELLLVDLRIEEYLPANEAVLLIN